MKLLKDILYKAGLEDVSGSTNIAITMLTTDSRQVKNYSLFIAVKGSNIDGHLFIKQAVENGAIAVICETLPEERDKKVTYVKVKNSSYALGIIASNFYDNPSEKLKLVGVTGTNGKTTVATLLYRLYQNFGFKAGLLSTVVNKINTVSLPATHTTPDAINLNSLLSQMVEADCKYCFMEVSSHAIDQNRIAGLRFAGAIFTNITHDHLDYHKTFDNYLKAKQDLFTGLPSSAFAIVNADDKNGKIMVQNSKAKKWTYGLKGLADFKGKIIENQLSGLLMNIDNKEILTRLIGSFNAYNLLAVYSTAVLLGENKLDVLTGISALEAVEGRFQYIKTGNNIIGVVDYAHTPDALENVLRSIRDIRTGNETLITIVGCGGDRDRTKRPLMAKIACTMSDKVILTSDNPRSEKAEDIIDEMKKGVDPSDARKTVSITDRKEAIRTACIMAKPGDIILLAGKGHEKYQEINGVKHPFDDMKILTESLKQAI